MNLFEAIEEFHKKFNLPTPEKPEFASPEIMKFRIKFMQEELDEFCEAYVNDNIEDAFDALIDLCYVVLGTSYFMGLPFNDGFKIVHHCNMRKVRAKVVEDSKRGTKFDVIKPEGWQPPDLKHLVYNMCLVCGKYHCDNMSCPEMEPKV